MDTKRLNTAIQHLKKSDKVMARIIKHIGPITIAKTSSSHFHTLVRAIINQQLSVKAGRTIEKRILIQQGGRYFNAQRMLTLTETKLRACGISFKKIHYIHSLSRAITKGELNFRKLAQQDNESIRTALIQYPGIGPWSADMFLISSLRRPDVFPVGDLVVRKTMQKYYRISEDSKYESYISIAQKWHPFETIASLYLWKASG